MCSRLLSLETPNDVESVALHSKNIQATCKGSDQTARMRRLIWGFAGRTNHIAGNPMPMLNNLDLVLVWDNTDFFRPHTLKFDLHVISFNVTMKIRSRSPETNQVFSMPNVIARKFDSNPPTSSRDILSCKQESVMATPTGYAPKKVCYPPRWWLHFGKGDMKSPCMSNLMRIINCIESTMYVHNENAIALLYLQT